jgi:hypothetical protein
MRKEKKSYFINYLPILVDFLLSKRFFERVERGTTFLAEKVGAPPNSDLRSLSRYHAALSLAAVVHGDSLFS